MENLKRGLNKKTNTEVISDALAFLKWVINETDKGRQIVSKNPDGSEPLQVII
jgi:hypothetical protein